MSTAGSTCASGTPTVVAARSARAERRGSDRCSSRRRYSDAVRPEAPATTRSAAPPTPTRCAESTSAANEPWSNSPTSDGSSHSNRLEISGSAGQFHTTGSICQTMCPTHVGPTACARSEGRRKARLRKLWDIPMNTRFSGVNVARAAAVAVVSELGAGEFVCGALLMGLLILMGRLKGQPKKEAGEQQCHAAYVLERS